MELFDVEYGAFLVFQLSLECWFDVVGEERDKGPIWFFLGRLLCRAARATLVDAVVGSVCRVTFLFFGLFRGQSSLGVTMVLLALLFAGGGFYAAWLSFGEVVVDLLIGFRVCCEGNNSSLNVVFLLVYHDAASGVFDYSECGSTPGGVVLRLVLSHWSSSVWLRQHAATFRVIVW